MKILLLFSILFAGLLPVAFAADRPNIILILTDDQDMEAIGAYGGDVWTPNLDRMAAEGMLFSNAFVTSTVCTPSRYSFLTGRYASRSTSDIFLHENPAGHQAYTAFNMGLEENNLNIGAMLSQQDTAPVLSANTTSAESKICGPPRTLKNAACGMWAAISKTPPPRPPPSPTTNFNTARC